MPERDVRGNEVRVGERCNAKRSVGRNHQSIGSEVTVPGVNDGIEHGFEEETVTHPFGDNDIDLLDGKSHFLDFATDAPVIKGSIWKLIKSRCIGYIRDHITKTILINDLLSPVDNVRIVNSNDLFCTCFSAEHGEDPRATPDVQHNLVLEDTLIVIDEVTIGVSADSILKHRLMNPCKNTFR